MQIQYINVGNGYSELGGKEGGWNKTKIQAEKFVTSFIQVNKGKVHPCTGTEALYRPYGP
jgi:hypothetical protein